MDNYKGVLITIATFCFSIVILVYQWLVVNLPATSSNLLLSQIILYLTSVGFYVIIFKISTYIYFKYFHDFLKRSNLIDGKWYYIQHIEGNNSYRTGYCEIEHSENIIMISGNGFFPEDNSFSNRWQSEIAMIKGRQLICSYESIGVRSKQVVRRGLILCNLMDKPPKYMHGFWTDIGTNDSRGMIIFFKEKKTFDQETNKLSLNILVPDK